MCWTDREGERFGKKIFFLAYSCFLQLFTFLLGAYMMNEKKVFRYIVGMWNYMFNAIIFIASKFIF